MTLSRQTLETALSALRMWRMQQQEHINMAEARGYISPDAEKNTQNTTTAIKEIEEALKEDTQP